MFDGVLSMPFYSLSFETHNLHQTNYFVTDCFDVSLLEMKLMKITSGIVIVRNIIYWTKNKERVKENRMQSCFQIHC